MSTWNIFLLIVLAVFLTLYVLLAVLKTESTKSIFERAVNDPIPLSYVQRVAFNQSMNLLIRNAHFWQGVILSLASVVLVLFDSRLFIVTAMFCVCFAAWHFYQMKQIVD